MKKRTVALLLALVLVFGAAVGGTLAWLTSFTETVTNTFTVGNVAITLDEDDYDNSTSSEDGARDIANTYKLMPGSEYAKDPTVHVANTSEAAYIYVAVDNGIAGIEVAPGEDKTIAEQMEDNGWVKLMDGENQVTISTGAVWYYNAVVEAGDDVVVFETITIAGDADLEGFNDTVEITAYAIQSENMASAAAAWEQGAGDWT